MSRYLDRLILEKRQPDVLQKAQKGGYYSFCSTEGRHILEKQTAPHPPQRQGTPPGSAPALRSNGTEYNTRLADEAERRADFCNLHRDMLGGTCRHFDMIKRLGGFPENWKTTGAEWLDGFPEYNKTTDRAGFIENNKSTSPGDQAKALDACLLWRLIRCGEKIERAAPAEIVGGVTVADVLRWVLVNAKDVEVIRKERRLLLTCAESLQGSGHFWEK